MASASSSVSGAAGPLLGTMDRTYLGRVGSCQSRGVCQCLMAYKVPPAHLTGRETEAQ